MYNKCNKLFIFFLFIYYVSNANDDFIQKDESLNIQLISQIPIEKCNSIFVRDSIAFIGTDSLFIIMGLSDPLQPQTIGSCSVPSTVTEIILEDTMAYILTSEKGLRIINISDYQNPVELSFYSVNLDTVYFNDIFIHDTLAFIADRDSGVRIVSISDIHNIYDISMINNSIFPVYGNYKQPTALCVRDNYCYVGVYSFDLYPFSSIVTIDVTDVVNPIISTNAIGVGELIEHMNIYNNFLYICEYERGFFVYDVSTNPEIPLYLNYLFWLGNWYGYGGSFFKDNYAYISRNDNDGNLWIIDISDSLNLQRVSEFQFNGDADGLFVDHNYIYLCSYSGYLYLLKFIDPSDIEDINNLSLKNFSLEQNYPNPFNPISTIVFTLPRQESVKMEVFNLLGQKIETLINRTMSAGSHEVEFNAMNLPSGIYMYKLKAGNFQSIKKMLYQK